MVVIALIAPMFIDSADAIRRNRRHSLADGATMLEWQYHLPPESITRETPRARAECSSALRAGIRLQHDAEHVGLGDRVLLDLAIADPGVGGCLVQLDLVGILSQRPAITRERQVIVGFGSRALERSVEIGRIAETGIRATEALPEAERATGFDFMTLEEMRQMEWLVRIQVVFESLVR